MIESLTQFERAVVKAVKAHFVYEDVYEAALAIIGQCIYGNPNYCYFQNALTVVTEILRKVGKLTVDVQNYAVLEAVRPKMTLPTFTEKTVDEVKYSLICFYLGKIADIKIYDNGNGVHSGAQLIPLVDLTITADTLKEVEKALDNYSGSGII